MGEQIPCEICGHTVDQLEVFECGKCSAIFCSASCEEQHRCDVSEDAD